MTFTYRIPTSGCHLEYSCRWRPVPLSSFSNLLLRPTARITHSSALTTCWPKWILSFPNAPDISTMHSGSHCNGIQTLVMSSREGFPLRGSFSERLLSQHAALHGGGVNKGKHVGRRGSEGVSSAGSNRRGAMLDQWHRSWSEAWLQNSLRSLDHEVSGSLFLFLLSMRPATWEPCRQMEDRPCNASLCCWWVCVCLVHESMTGHRGFWCVCVSRFPTITFCAVDC